MMPEATRVTALEYLNQSLAIYQVIGDRVREGDTLNDIALIHDARGDHATALEYLKQAWLSTGPSATGRSYVTTCFVWDVFIL